MSKAAEFGRGSFTYIGKVQEVGEKMGTLFAKLESPVLTQLNVEFPRGITAEMWPAKLPDLYSGEPLVFTAAFEGTVPAKTIITLSGLRGTTPWQANLALDASTPASVHTLWARSKIQSLLDGTHAGAETEGVRKQVTEIALEHHLVSKYTSLVAVDVTPVRPAHAALSENLPVATNLPEGWNYDAVFGQLPQGATPAQWQMLIGSLLLSCAVIVQLLRRKVARV